MSMGLGQTMGVLTVSELAKKFSLSRATILYYEREGLLLPATRGQNGYRYYTTENAETLRRIVGYRACGISVAQIRVLLSEEQEDENRLPEMVQEHFLKLEDRIGILRRQQYAIVSLLIAQKEQPDDRLTLASWHHHAVSAGLTGEDMKDWHRMFENVDPAGHTKFLEYLGCDSRTVEDIRNWSDETLENLIGIIRKEGAESA